jgi:hypothetical protein
MRVNTCDSVSDAVPQRCFLFECLSFSRSLLPRTNQPTLQDPPKIPETIHGDDLPDPAAGESSPSAPPTVTAWNTGAKAGVVVTGGDAVDFDGILVFPSAALGQDYNGQAFARVLTEDKEATNTVVTQCTKLLENYPKTYFAAVKKTVSPEDFAKFKKCIASADMNGEYSDRFLFAPIYDEESWTIRTHPCHLRIGILLTPHCKQLPSNHRAARFKSAFTRSREQPILEAAELHSLIRPQCGLTPQIRHNSFLSTATGSAPESR